MIASGVAKGYEVVMWIVKRCHGLGRRIDIIRWALKTGIQEVPEMALYVARYPSIIVYPLCNNVNPQSISFACSSPEPRKMLKRKHKSIA